MGQAGIAVEITVKGRIAPSTGAAVGRLDIDIVPRHDVVLVPSGELTDLLTTLDLLQRRGIEVSRICHPGVLPGVGTEPPS